MPVPVINGRSLGRLPYDPTKPNVRLRRRRGATLSPPAQSDWGCDAMNTMALNDDLGCCTISAKVHIVTSQQFYGQSRTVVVPDAEVLKGYQAVSGYKPGQPRTDVGATMQDSYDYWRKTGFLVSGASYRIEAFAEIPTGSRGELDHDMIKTCIDAFGAVDMGMSFPDFAMDQFDANQVWDYNPRKRFNIDGGHDAPYIGYGGSGAGAYYDVWTWGRRQRMSVAFAERFCEEFWTHGERDWQRLDGTVPNGIDGQAALAEFEALVNGDGAAVGWDGAPPAPVDPPVDPTPEPDPPAPVGDPDGELSHAFDVWRAAKGL